MQSCGSIGMHGEAMVFDSSMSSVNNGWKNWIILHGNEEVSLDDVWGIGKVISVKMDSSKNGLQ